MLNTHNHKMVVVTPPAAIIDNASAVTAAIDTSGFDYVDIYAVLGATDIAMAALKLQQSDESGANFVDIAGADFSAVALGLPSATDDNKVYAFHVNMVGKKKYLDVVATAGDGAAGTFLTIVAILSRAKEYPNTAAKRGVAKEVFV